MNRTGLYIALGLAAVYALLFTLYPQIDLELARRHFDAASRSFPEASVWSSELVRQGAMWLSWAFATPAIVALVVKLIWPQRPLLIGGRSMLFILATIALSAGLFSNAIFKSHWARPRPVATQDFGGPWAFKPWWDPRGACPRNCSFYSGEAATAFWTYAPASLAPPPMRPLAYAAATVFGLATGYLRMTFGGHYASDVVFAGIATFIIVWAMYWLIFRRTGTRLSDEAIDRALGDTVMAIRRPFRRSKS